MSVSAGSLFSTLEEEPVCNGVVSPAVQMEERKYDSVVSRLAMHVKKEQECDGISPATVSVREWNEDQMLILPTEVLNDEADCNGAILPAVELVQERDCNGDQMLPTEALHDETDCILPTEVSLKEREWNSDQILTLPTEAFNDEVDCILPTTVDSMERELDDDHPLMLPTGVLNKEVNSNNAMLPAVTVKEEPEWDDNQMLMLPTEVLNNEVEYNSAMLPSGVTVKQEREWDDDQMLMLPTGVINEEADGSTAMLPAVRVKEEPVCDASDSAAALYADHEVKQELVLGPEELQKQDIAYTPRFLKPDEDNINQMIAAAWSTLNQHKVKEHSCSKCPKKFDSRLSLLNHHLLIHKRKKAKSKKLTSNYECDICKKQYVHKVALDKHVKTHMGTGKSFVCKVCGKHFYAQRTFLRHKQIGSECWFQGT